MGATHSTSITTLEEAPSQPQPQPPSLASLSHLPVGDPPQLRREETFEEKLFRKCSSEPLVPIGLMATIYFLGSGIGSFYKRDAQRSQKMMRFRVAAQFFTIMAFIGYTGLENFDLRVAPMYQEAKKAREKAAAEAEALRLNTNVAVPTPKEGSTISKPN